MIPESGVGQNDGETTVNIVAGGTAPYTYLWDDPNNQTTSTAIGLAGNTTYTVIVTDANGCIKTFLVFVAGKVSCLWGAGRGLGAFPDSAASISPSMACGVP